jgi:hypothetical protein
MSANISVGFKHGDVVFLMQMPRNGVASNASTYDSDFHFLARLWFKTSTGTWRKSQIKPNLESIFKP